MDFTHSFTLASGQDASANTPSAITVALQDGSPCAGGRSECGTRAAACRKR